MYNAVFALPRDTEENLSHFRNEKRRSHICVAQVQLNLKSVLRPTTKSGCLTDYSSPKQPRVYSFIGQGTEMVPRRSKGTKKRTPYTC